MKTPKIIFLLASLISYFLLINQSLAGNGYYIGADYLRNSIKINTASSVSNLALSVEDEQKISSNDYGLRFGYRHKINQYIYISPELFYQSLDRSSYLYSTSMKAGFVVKNLSLFASLGYAEIDKFNNSAENFGFGAEYKINDNFSIGAEFIKFGDVKTSDRESGAISTRVDKTNQLQTIKFGISYYFHE